VFEIMEEIDRRVVRGRPARRGLELGAGARRRGRHGAMRAFERLHKETQAQCAAGRPVEEGSSRPARGLPLDAREERGDARESCASRSDKPWPGLEAIRALRYELGAQARAQMDATRRAVREAWFAVYDALDPARRNR